MIARIKKRTIRRAAELLNQPKASGKVKYFCIGRNKTGTTSLKLVFEDLGYSVGNQRKVKIITGKNCFEGNFQPIVDYCKRA